MKRENGRNQQMKIKELLLLTAGKKSVRGMSLLEIMVVIVLIGLVTSMIGVAVMNQLEQGKIDVARSAAMGVESAIEQYSLRNHKYPTTGEGLAVLVNPPKGRPFMEKLPKDPWDNEFLYLNPGAKNTNKFDVISKGPDGQEGTEDDIGNWDEE